MLLQDKLRLPRRTGQIRRAAVRLRVRIRDSEGSTCRTGRGTPRRARGRTESGGCLLREGGPPRRYRGSGGDGGGEARRPATAARPGSAARGPGRPPHPARCPHQLSSTPSPTRRPVRRCGPASDAAAGTEEQRSVVAAPPPLCDTAYQSLAVARVALQSAGAGAGPDRRTPAGARAPGLLLRSVVVVG